MFQLLLLKDVDELLVNCLDILVVQIPHLDLGQPKLVLLKAALDKGFTILRLVENQISRRDWFLSLDHADSPPIISRIRSVTCLSSASITSSGLGGVNT